MKTSLFFIILFSTIHFTFGQWTQLGQNIDGEAAGDLSGQAVSMSSNGTIVAIGAPSNDGNGNNYGHVRVYQFNGVSWDQLGQDIDGPAYIGYFGSSVSLSADGTRLAVGAPQANFQGWRTGHVYMYEFDGVNWSQLGQHITGESADDRFGRSVSMNADGGVVAIGAYLNDGNGSNSGHVRVYRLIGNTWSRWGQDIDGEAAGDNSGFSVSLSNDGTILAVGAHRNDGNNGNGSGHVRIYEHDGVDWSQLGQDIDGEATYDRFGWSVSLSSDGHTVGAGGYFNDDNGSSAGHTRVYQFDGVSWNQLGQDLDGEAANDYSGYSVSLGGNGNRLAVGAIYNDGNGSASGHTRIYEYDGGFWNQVGQDIDGEVAVDQSGYAVSLSEDGSRLAIGAPYNDTNGSDSGHVRVFSNSIVDYTSIPDTNFEQTLIDQGIDSEGILDGQVLTDDLTGVTTLNVANSNIYNLTGIEDFAVLDTLYCEFNMLTNLNVTQNPNLTFLSCYNNQLTNLDVTQNPGLTTLWTATNQLADLDVSQNPNLTDLRCFSNQLTTLDVSQNPNLIELRCYDNQLTTLEFTQNPNLLYVYCNTNALATIDVSQNSDLITLACHENLLTDLDVSQNPNLAGLYSHNNPLLSCIEVANAVDADAGVGIYTGWSRDGGTAYSEDCGTMARSTNISNTKDTEEATETEAPFITSNIVLYPNPVKDNLYIVLPPKRELLNVIIYNTKGEQVATTKTTTMSITHLAKGVYFVKIQLENGERLTKKVVISRD